MPRPWPDLIALALQPRCPIDRLDCMAGLDWRGTVEELERDSIGRWAGLRLGRARSALHPQGRFRFQVAADARALLSVRAAHAQLLDVGKAAISLGAPRYPTTATSGEGRATCSSSVSPRRGWRRLAISQWLRQAQQLLGLRSRWLVDGEANSFLVAPLRDSACVLDIRIWMASRFTRLIEGGGGPRYARQLPCRPTPKPWAGGGERAAAISARA